MDPTPALSALRAIEQLDFGSDRTASASSVGSGPSFTETLKAAAGQTVDTLRNAEQLSVKAITGDADMRDVTDAVLNAEQNLQAAIAIRDKVVTAFLEVSRMQI